MYDKTARPTIRLLQQDLKDGWSDSYKRRAVSKGQWNDLHPFAAVEHPIVAKCAEALPADPERDSTSQVIVSSQALRLTEVRQSQWRAGVWTDSETGVRWIVAAGLAKGGHEDHDDFYQKLAVQVDSNDGELLLPTDKDKELLRAETAAQSLLVWELKLQNLAAEALVAALNGESFRFDLSHPLAKQSIGYVMLEHEVVDDCSELVVEFVFSNAHQSSELGWLAITRILNALYPPVQGWDRTQNIFSVMGEAGFLEPHLERLGGVNSDQTLIEGEPGTSSHYAHRRHLSDRTIDGKSVRSLCGIYFVPSQDHEKFPECPSCMQNKARIERLTPSLD